MQYFKIARVNQVRFSVRFVTAISQGFRTCLKLDAILLLQKLHRLAATKITCVNGPLSSLSLMSRKPFLRALRALCNARSYRIQYICWIRAGYPPFECYVIFYFSRINGPIVSLEFEEMNDAGNHFRSWCTHLLMKVMESEEWSSQLIFQFKQLERRSLKKSGLQGDSNPWPPRYRYDALPTELCSHTLGARSIYWVHVSCEEWNDVNIYEIIHIWTAVVDESEEWSSQLIFQFTEAIEKKKPEKSRASGHGFESR